MGATPLRNLRFIWYPAHTPEGSFNFRILGLTMSIKKHEWCKKLVYTTNEASEILGVSSKTITRMVNDGRLPRLQGMRNILIPVKPLEQWVTDNTVYNPASAERASLTPTGERRCISARRKKESSVEAIVLTGGSVTPTQAAKGLNDLLGLQTKRRH